MTIEQTLDISPAELEEIFELPAYEHDKGYRLVALDDSVTPMDYVTMVFMKVLALPLNKALELMLQVHVSGRAEIFKGSFEECNAKRDMILGLNEAYDQNLFTLIEKIDS